MAALAQTVVDADGASMALANAAGGGDTVIAGDTSWVEINNADGTSTDVTLVTPGTVAGLAVADRVVAVAAGARIGIAVGDEYRDSTTGRASLTYSKVTGPLTIGSFRR